MANNNQVAPLPAEVNGMDDVLERLNDFTNPEGPANNNLAQPNNRRAVLAFLIRLALGVSATIRDLNAPCFVSPVFGCVAAILEHVQAVNTANIEVMSLVLDVALVLELLKPYLTTEVFRNGAWDRGRQHLGQLEMALTQAKRNIEVMFGIGCFSGLKRCLGAANNIHLIANARAAIETARTRIHGFIMLDPYLRDFLMEFRVTLRNGDNRPFYGTHLEQPGQNIPPLTQTTRCMAFSVADSGRCIRCNGHNNFRRFRLHGDQYTDHLPNNVSTRILYVCPMQAQHLENHLGAAIEELYPWGHLPPLPHHAAEALNEEEE